VSDEDPLLEALRVELIDRGIVRHPRTPGPADLPPMWFASREGTPAPGEPSDATGDRAIEVGPDIVIGATRATGIPSRRMEGFIELAAVELWLRCQLEAIATAVHKQLRLALHDRRAWVMGNSLRIEESLMFRELQPIERTPQGFTYSTEFFFEIWDHDWESS
jgi:hypothetical protein